MSTNKYLEKVAASIGDLSEDQKGSLATQVMAQGLLGQVVGNAVPPLGFIGNSYLSRKALEKYIPNSKKDNWVGMHSMGHGLVGQAVGGGIGGSLGAGIGHLTGNPKLMVGGAIAGGLVGLALGDRAGRKYHINHSSDFTND